MSSMHPLKFGVNQFWEDCINVSSYDVYLFGLLANDNV